MQESEQNEISVTEILVKIKKWIKYCFSIWYYFVLLIAIGGLGGLLFSIFKKPSYTATLTFVLSTETKASGIAGLASQFGIDFGASGGSDVFSGDNIISLFQSKKMIEAVLFKNTAQSGTTLINTIVKEWEWDKKWNKRTNLRNLFPFPENINSLNGVQDSLVEEVYNNIAEKEVSVLRTDKKLSVFKLSTTSESEIFAYYMTKFLMDQTAEFYIDTKTSLARNNLRMLQKEADSLRRLLGGSIVSNASEVDRTFNLNPALQIQRSGIQKGQVNVTVLGTAYGEVVKNLELAKINLQKETPLYQILDTPHLPLKAARLSKITGFIIGSLIGFFIFILFYPAKKLWKALRS